jgi:opacity protein-like surface antigen
MRHWTLVLFRMVLLATLTSVACAQVSTKGNVFFGYSYNRAEVFSNDDRNLNGWDASLEGKFLPWIGVVADLGGTYGGRVSEHNFLFGPRISAQAGRYRPFAELLIGASHVSISDDGSDTSFGNAVGGGLDYRVVGPVAARGQLDWIHTRFFGHGQDDVRFSTGIVVRF